MKHQIQAGAALCLFAALTSASWAQSTGPVDGATPTPAPAVAPAPPPPAAPNLVIPNIVVDEKPFIESFPNLKPYVYKEPPSGFFLGFGLSPVGVLKDRTMFTADFFQLHFINTHWDFQILGASYGVTRAQSTIFQSNNFVFSANAKYKIGNTFSLGPLVGYEFVNFPNLDAKLLKAPYETPYESFSSQGIIYGGIVSETFPYKDYLIQISELAYQETYSNTTTPQGWKYYYDSPEVRGNPALIAASVVTMIEMSFLF